MLVTYRKISMKYRVLWSHRQKYRMMTAGLAIVGSLAWCAAQAAPIALGFISWDVTIPGSFGQFDITNMTGPNESPPGFPVDTEVQFTSSSLVVHFSDGSTTTFGPSYFTLNPDGESLDGSPIAIGGVSPQPTEASLSGDMTPTTIDVSGTPTTVDASFDMATILPSSPPNLADGDFAVINAEPAAVSATPEPDMILTLILGSSMGPDPCPSAAPTRRFEVTPLRRWLLWRGRNPVSGSFLRRHHASPEYRVDPWIGGGGNQFS
jgi:hypothetical protein